MKVSLPLCFGLVLVSCAEAQVLPTNAVVVSRTISEWTAEWWKWAWTTSTNQNPFFDTNGVWASSNQPEGDVFFLAGISTLSGMVQRSFSVPQGKYLFLPVINSYCDNVDVVPPMNVPDLRQCAAAQVQATTELHAAIDGVQVTNLFGYRLISPVFNFVHETADNLESWVAGHPVVGLIDPAVADGFWLMLEPLAPGTHLLNFGGTFGDQFHFTIDITDFITVVPTNLPPVAVLPNDAVVDGKTIAQWTAEWWKWIWLQPTNNHVWLDPDGRWATNAQPDASVFFVAGVVDAQGNGVRTRRFTISEDKHLLFGLANVAPNNIDTVPALTIEELRALGASALAGISELHLTINGVAVPDLFQHRVMSPVYSYVLPDDGNNFNTIYYGHPITGLVDPEVSDGYWIMTEPLSPGVHVINWGSSFGPPVNFTLDVTDIITVVPLSIPERIDELIAAVRQQDLPLRREDALLRNLQRAAKWFERERPRTAIAHLRLFQKKVRNLLRNDPATAGRFIQDTQTIIDRAKQNQGTQP